MTTPGKLTVGKDGKITGPVTIEYNQPWPCVNGTPHVTGAMRGVLMHTMVGNQAGTIASFNDPNRQASAHFGIAQDGSVHQFGPVGSGWMAWHAMAANLEWYGIEHTDDGNPNNPLTDAQITASAQLVECLAAFAGFPLQVTDRVFGHGYGIHATGGPAWGGHTCPDLPPKHVRSEQRHAIIALAKQIRGGVVKPPLPAGIYHADGKTSMADLAHRQGEPVSAIWWATVIGIGNSTSFDKPVPGFGLLESAYLDAGKWDALMPSGLILWLP